MDNEHIMIELKKQLADIDEMMNVARKYELRAKLYEARTKVLMALKQFNDSNNEV